MHDDFPETWWNALRAVRCADGAPVGRRLLAELEQAGLVVDGCLTRLGRDALVAGSPRLWRVAA
jgi:hypothetical protein